MSEKLERMKISMCNFQNGEFDLFIEDADTGESIAITGNRKFTDEEHELLQRLMPSCVMTTYERVPAKNGRRR